MGTGYDCFDPLANTANPTITPTQTANRALLVNAMTRAGFTNLPEEWWHYTLAAEPFPTTYFNAPIRRDRHHTG
jgi:D-alanyl-D-alanine dipeptidase